MLGRRRTVVPCAIFSNARAFSKHLFLTLIAGLFCLAGLGWTSSASAAPGCSGVASTDVGSFAGLTDQQVGFGNPDGIVPFLEAQGLTNPTRVDKIDGLQGNTDCHDGESGVVSAASDDTSGLSGKWKSDVAICAIAVHAGGGQRVAVYIYDPAVTEGAWTTENNTNKQGNPQAISNIQFFTCDEGGGDEKGTIKLQKTTQGQVDEQDVGENTFTLKLTRTSDDPDTVFTVLIPVTGYDTASASSLSLAPGTYVFSEALPPEPQNIPEDSEWEQTSLQCVITSDQGGGTVINNDTEVVLGPNDEVTCTATNNLVRKDVGKGKIVIKKSATGVTDPVTFEFTWVNSNGEGLANPSIEFTSDGTGVLVFEGEDLRTGTYIIREEDLAGWNVTDISCDDGGSQSPSTTDLATKQATINLDDDETVTCTFTNAPQDEKGTIKIIKKTIGGDGTFSYTGSLVDAVPSLASLTTSGGEKVSGPHELDADTYVIREEQLEGWRLTELTCSGDDNSSVNLASGTATIDLDGEENVVCTFTNTRDGSMKLTKKAIGGAGDFTFKLDGITRVVHASGTQPGFEVFENLAPGSYTIEEINLPEGWQITNLYCSNQTAKTETSVTFNVFAGQSTHCTFTNFKKKDDKMEDVTKVFIHRRVDNLLSHDPDRARLLRRLQEQQPESLKDTGSLPPLKMSGQMDSETGSVSFSTSLSQMRASYMAEQARKQKLAKESAGEKASLWESDPYLAPYMMTRPGWDLWIEGQISRYDDSTGGIERDGVFKILYFGADYAIAPGVIVGALVQIDRTDEEIDDPDVWGQIEGTGWMVGPYFGAKITDSLIFDARAAWGRSDNDIRLTDEEAGTRTGSFDTERWLVTAKLTGLWYKGPWRFSPQIGVAWGNEDQDAYFNNIGQRIGANSITIGRLTFGPEFGYRTTLEDGTVIEPHLKIEGVWNFDTDELVIDGIRVETDEFRGKVEGGIIFHTPDGYKLRAAGSYDGLGDDDFEAWSAKAWLNIPLN